MANYPQELAHDAVCQSHTSHMTGLWFLPNPAFKAEYTTSYWLCHFPAPTQSGINTPHNPSTDILHSPAYEDGTDSEFQNVGN